MAVALAVYARSWPPFKAKQVDAILLFCIASFFYTTGTLKAYNVIPPVGVFAVCRFWNTFACFALGSQLYFAVATFRFQRLYYIIVKMESPRKSRWFWIVLIGSYFPAIILSLLPLGIDGLVTSEPIIIPGHEAYGMTCSCLSSVYMACAQTHIATQIVYILYLNQAVSKIKKSFNEFFEAQIYLGMAVIAFVVNLAILFTGLSWSVLGGYLTSIVTAIVCSGVIWSVLGRPIYGYLVDRDGYLQQWKQGLRNERLPHGLNYDSSLEANTAHKEPARQL
ncbi:hypothetical protein HDV03_002651 [Kappamyces sp. JEL0829]|nr:hypothetical protein HDV03_002651 [Kappamyces sp. JEL0829]